MPAAMLGEFRCTCGKLLAKLMLVAGSVVQIKCRCGETNTARGWSVANIVLSDSTQVTQWSPLDNRTDVR